MERRLAAIVLCDVPGYSRSMATDEAATLSALREARREVIDPAAARYGGRAIKLIGAAFWRPRMATFEPVAPETMAQPLPDKPSIAVLAFDDHIQGEDKGFLSDATSEDAHASGPSVTCRPAAHTIRRPDRFRALTFWCTFGTFYFAFFICPHFTTY